MGSLGDARRQPTRGLLAESRRQSFEYAIERLSFILRELPTVMPHVNDRYCNSMRYFGLLAPRSKMLLTETATEAAASASEVRGINL